MKEFLKKNWYLFLLAAILFLAIFFRVYHFSDWLHFGMDQARDANLVSEAVKNGPSQLPLLGPRAGGTFVRLGPIFYYFQYISAKIFHSVSPPVFAYPDLLFSILTIPLFFLFLRRFFQNTVSLLVASLYAFNFVIIQFSRFAWNPNPIPFWTLLVFYSLLKSADEDQKKRKYFWVIMAALGWAIAGQLHFIVLAAIPAVFFFFLLWTGKWRKYSWKEALLFFSIIAILFFPVILSDVKMKGDNLKQFLWAFEYKPQDHSIFSNFKTSISLRANYYTTILTTYTSPTGKGSLMAGLTLSLFGLGRVIYGIGKEKNEKRKNFLKLLFVWVSISFVILIPFAYQIKPRFLFFEIFVPFIFIGLGLEWLMNPVPQKAMDVRLWKNLKKIEGKSVMDNRDTSLWYGMKDIRFRKFTSFAAIILVFAVIGLNVEATFAWFQKMRNGDSFHIWGNRLAFVQYPKAITLSDSEKTADYLEAKWKEEPSKLYFYGNLELRNPPLYILESRNPEIDYSYFSFKTHDFSGRYFAITTRNGDFSSLPKYYQPKFDLLSDQKIGKLAVQELKLKDIQPTKSEVENLKEPKIDTETEKNVKKGLKKSDRVLWEDLFK